MCVCVAVSLSVAMFVFCDCACVVCLVPVYVFFFPAWPCPCWFVSLCLWLPACFSACLSQVFGVCTESILPVLQRDVLIQAGPIWGGCLGGPQCADDRARERLMKQLHNRNDVAVVPRG